MNDGQIEISGLSKSFGSVQAVNNLSFIAQPGRVTGFLGPNGSGKTTTMQMLLGLVRKDTGQATIGGKSYIELEHPARTVGSAIAAMFHPSHTARTHLDIVRRAIGAPSARVQEMLDLVGIADAADRKVGGFSLGMRQRLALAAALVGDPQVLVLDEPINGLDPEGIRWIRMFLRHFASEGKTVLLSSHLLSEVQQTVDDVIIIRKGELAFSGELGDLQRLAGGEAVLVDAADRAGLMTALRAANLEVQGARSEGALRVLGAHPAQVGEVALSAAVALNHLSVESVGLEQSFLDLIDQPNQIEVSA